jgi:hypothetical protein
VALVHYPVINKNREPIASAVTPIDLHDIARASRTYGIQRFYVVTPLEDQKRLTRQVIGHWVTGVGGEYNPTRKEALELISIADTVDEVLADMEQREKGKAKTVVTCAKQQPGSISFGRFQEMLKVDTPPYLLIFGTAWGLSPQFIESADYILEPIKGNTDYNHLSVRSAASIILDRLLGRD